MRTQTQQCREAPPPTASEDWIFGLGERVELWGVHRTGHVVARTEWMDEREEYTVRFDDKAEKLTFASFDLESIHVGPLFSANRPEWKLELGEAVTVCSPKVKGVVLSRTEWIDGREDYRVRIVAADGATTTGYFNSFDLVSIETGGVQ